MIKDECRCFHSIWPFCWVAALVKLLPRLFNTGMCHCERWYRWEYRCNTTFCGKGLPQLGVPREKMLILGPVLWFDIGFQLDNIPAQCWSPYSRTKSHSRVRIRPWVPRCVDYQPEMPTTLVSHSPIQLSVNRWMVWPPRAAEPYSLLIRIKLGASRPPLSLRGFFCSWSSSIVYSVRVNHDCTHLSNCMFLQQFPTLHHIYAHWPSFAVLIHPPPHFYWKYPVHILLI